MKTANGELSYPHHCRVSVSPDKTQLALTFRGDSSAPFTIVLPIAGAAGLQRKLTQSLYILGVQSTAGQDAQAVSPVPSAS